jgi:hypothetical protein
VCISVFLFPVAKVLTGFRVYSELKSDGWKLINALFGGVFFPIFWYMLHRIKPNWKGSLGALLIWAFLSFFIHYLYLNQSRYAYLSTDSEIRLKGNVYYLTKHFEDIDVIDDKGMQQKVLEVPANILSGIWKYNPMRDLIPKGLAVQVDFEVLKTNRTNLVVFKGSNSIQVVKGKTNFGNGT